jgi:hypothetical protein
MLSSKQRPSKRTWPPHTQHHTSTKQAWISLHSWQLHQLVYCLRHKLQMRLDACCLINATPQLHPQRLLPQIYHPASLL